MVEESVIEAFGRDGAVCLRGVFRDWVDVIADRQDPRKLVMKGRLRPRGDYRWLFKSRKMFPAP